MGKNRVMAIFCDVCGNIGDPDALVTCSRCKFSTEHLYCMRILLLEHPREWICEDCASEEMARNERSSVENCETMMEKAESEETVEENNEGSEAAELSENLSVEEKILAAPAADDKEKETETETN